MRFSKFVRLLAVCFVTLGAGISGYADIRTVETSSAGVQPQLVEGLVKKLDKATGKLTIQHGPLDHLNMPPMTMPFRVHDPKWMDKLQAGDKILFIAERVDGALTITKIKTAK